VRALAFLFFVALIAVGLFTGLELEWGGRPTGGLAELRALPERDDLSVMLIVVDTLRADRLSAYGYERPTSPILEELAATGVRFENALAQSTWTKSSMASMLTGTYPAHNRIQRFDQVVPESATLVSEVLQRAGLRTIGLWRNNWVGPKFGFDQGYDHYVKPLPRARDVTGAGRSWERTDQELVESTAQFLRTVGDDERFYVYLHLMDLHQYVYDGSVHFGTGLSDIYDQSIRYVDTLIGAVLGVLQQEGLLRRTLVAVVSDHGEAFGEHGTTGHAQDLYGETTQVPFLLALPFQLDEPAVVEAPVENVDVWPTLLDLLGLPPLPDADGHSLVPWIEAAIAGREPPADPGRRHADLDRHWGEATLAPRPRVLVEDGPWRLHKLAGRRAELYAIREDAAERHDLAAEHPDVVARLEDAVRAYLETPEPIWGLPETTEIDAEEAARLRALGYAVKGEERIDADAKREGKGAKPPPD